MKTFLETIVLFYTIDLVVSNQSFNYEKMQNYGLGRRVIQNYQNFRRSNKGYEYPEPLPTTPPPDNMLVRAPYQKLYQGTRRLKMDKRVFRKSFEYPATYQGHRILCESLVNCTISHIAIETEKGIPIILRGGVGYHHFSIIVRAEPGNPLKGTIRVYCTKTPLDLEVGLHND